MDYRRDSTDAAARRKARRERDDASPRLSDSVPRLQALHFEVSVTLDGADLNAARHVKRFMVAQAPASFVIDCTDPACREGGHDLTQVVLAQLAAARERFETEAVCSGKSGDKPCGRLLHVIAIASYHRASGGAR